MCVMSVECSQLVRLGGLAALSGNSTVTRKVRGA
jgi:hypothetical protein